MSSVREKISRMGSRLQELLHLALAVQSDVVLNRLESRDSD